MFVRRALLSVSDKTDLVEFARALHDAGVELVGTAGTAATLMSAGLPVRPVSDLTRYPDAFLGGRVKTLQPALYAGLLADRENADHMRDLERSGFSPIDLLCLNLYPFGGTDQDDLAVRSAITHIDIGGPMLLRAAALNHRHVAVVTRPSQYEELVATLVRNRNALPEGLLGRLAAQAFALVSSYEAQVSAWFSDNLDMVAAAESPAAPRIEWRRCERCGGAAASSRWELCLRHLEAADRRSELEARDGEIDLRNVEVPPSLFAEILASCAAPDGRPRLRSLRCEWTQFEGSVSLECAIINGDVDFSGARFGGDLNASDVVVTGELRCRDVRFRTAMMESARVEGLATFRAADFNRASFDRAQFNGATVFERTGFASDASFRRAVFRGDASFIGARFDGSADFTDAQWLQDSRFRDTRFAKPPISRDLARFREASWPQHGTDMSTAPNASQTLSTVFIGSSSESLDVARAVQQNLDHDAQTILWTQGAFEAGGIALQSLKDTLRTADFAVFVLAPDDTVRFRGSEQRAPRDNVIWESGLAAGVLGTERTCLVIPRSVDLKIPTDLNGVNMCTFDANRPNLRAAMGAACTDIRDAIRRLGPR